MGASTHACLIYGWSLDKSELEDPVEKAEELIRQHNLERADAGDLRGRIDRENRYVGATLSETGYGKWKAEVDKGKHDLPEEELKIVGKALEIDVEEHDPELMIVVTRG